METVLSLPQSARIVFGRVEWSQPELLARAATVARHLRERWGTRPGDRVALMMTAAPEVVPSILGVWMAGAAYVPIDPLLPDERILQIARDAGLRGVVTQKAHRITVGLLGTRLDAPLAALEVDQLAPASLEPVPAELRVPSDRPAYLIYTSGSTGQPKGVVCHFRGLANLIEAVRAPLGLSPRTRHLQFASLSFDASVWEMFPTLFAGGTLVQATREDMLPGSRLAQLLRDQHVTHLCVPPSVLGKQNAFADTLPELECIVMAGERCPPALAGHWLKGRRVVNAYGPTEATVCATLYQVKGGESPVPIGRELAGARVRVVDAGGRDCPDGTPGELWIGGLGVADGYRGLPVLTQQRFPRDAGGGAWYRSGDQAVRRGDGELVFLGRVDHQVKLRGFRIELEAVEQALYAFPGMAQAAAKVFEEHDAHGVPTGILAAYVSATDGRTLPADALRAHVASVLPDYMVPHHFVQLPQLPLMPNGSKVDYGALQAPAGWRQAQASAAAEGASSATPLERLCRAFAEALGAGAGDVTPSDHFFRRGGDSLGVAHLLAVVEQVFGVALPSHAVYSHPTPAALLPFCLQEAGAGQQGKSVREELLEDAAWEAPSLAGMPRVEGLPRRVLLTGGTGFLGIHLLAALASRVERVDCLVRARDEAEATARLLTTAARYGVRLEWNERLRAIPGDITHETLGLSPDAYRQLARECDAIVHAAANISYILPYADAGKPNAQGTRHILAFATAERVKPLHHVSSLSVYGATAPLLGLPVVDEDFDIDQSLDVIAYENGYTRAKWVAEKMVGHARKAGVPVSIYRPGFIEGDSHSGIGNPDDLFCRLVVGNLQLGMYPDFARKYWLTVPVDYVARAMAHIVCTRPAGGNYNLLPPREQEPSNNALFELLGQQLGLPMEKVAPHAWLRELGRIGPQNALFPLANFLREKVYRNSRTVLELHYDTSLVRCDQTEAALAGSGITCPNIDATLLALYVDRLRAHYALPQPPTPAGSPAKAGQLRVA